MSTSLFLAPAYPYSSPRNSMSSARSSASSSSRTAGGSTPPRRTTTPPPASFFDSTVFLQTPPRELVRERHEPKRDEFELDKLEQLAEEVQQLQKQQVLSAMAGHGYSPMLSGLYTKPPAAPPSTPTKTSFSTAQQMSRRPMVALPDSPRVDQFAV